MIRAVGIIFSLLLLGCGKPTLEPEGETLRQYLHISHTRTAKNPSVDSEVEEIDFKNYDMLLLGGDLAHATSADNETLYHMNSIFKIGSWNTLWALGNHDYANINRIRRFTNRAPYYAHSKNGITFIVLDTQDSLSSFFGDQLEMFNKCDGHPSQFFSFGNPSS